ncbi:MAG: bifunctional methylenetetrahydrofolate dehydrogenase/methenyltetrahydrofolate cyclohydrolase FolD [Clostridiales bacterium]|nr:bifunctional methylenetetrahydrofolate dehydrogenase/methenyltetrahydrofolate cyclohydrolase FolD [Clostridiales bacterium]
MAEILSGKLMSEELTRDQARRVAEMKEQGIHPGLAVVLVGEDPASQIYVRNKGIACETIGLYSRTVKLDKDIPQAELIKAIQALNEDPLIHGILVQLPLPKHLDEEVVLASILPEKDVDGFHIDNAGRLFTGQEGVVACTPKGIMYMLKQAGVPLAGKEAVVIGRSNIVGKPVAMLLLGEHCTVTICHSRTQNLKDHCRRADILVAAIGKPHFVTADMVKPGAAVVDVGINRVDGKVVGDVDYEAVKDIAGYITPVPGGVGKMTISMLMENTLEAACRQAR